jgi:pimeloyl-ACP methyl ester carboxylesterase
MRRFHPARGNHENTPAARRLPHGELSWVAGAGHVLQEDAPAQLFGHLIVAFPVR